MTEQDRPTPTPEELHQIKDELVSLWERLPAEHQATMALVLIDRVMQGEMGAWLKEAITIKWSGNEAEIRENILTNWRRLPPDTQAGVMVEMVQDVLGSEQGKPLRRALGWDNPDLT